MRAAAIPGYHRAMSVSSRAASARAEAVYDVIVPLWPDAGTELSYASCFELLVAVILSAQCTDEQVNKATPALFAAYPDPSSMMEAPLPAVEALVRSTGFYRTKAAHIVASARLIVEHHGGRVPDTIEELVLLPGVGRKTANLVASLCYGRPGIVVDTHVKRAARRLGLCPSDDPDRVERSIAAALPEDRWTAFSFALNRHGKFVCTARKPRCPGCPLSLLCPSAASLSG